jgi:hypothetical protein
MTDSAHEDTEVDMVAFDVSIDGGGASAEEAAMHVIDAEAALMRYSSPVRLNDCRRRPARKVRPVVSARVAGIA